MVDKNSFEIEDNEHVILCCSDCDKPLIDVWVTRSEYPAKHQIRAECYFCGDQSFIANVKGAFHLGACNGVGISDIETEKSDDDEWLQFHFIKTVNGKVEHGDS